MFYPPQLPYQQPNVYMNRFYPQQMGWQNNSFSNGSVSTIKSNMNQQTLQMSNAHNSLNLANVIPSIPQIATNTPHHLGQAASNSNTLQQNVPQNLTVSSTPNQMLPQVRYN